MDTESRSSWALGVSLVQVMLLLVFAAMMVYVTDNVEGGGPEPQTILEEPKIQDAGLQASLDAAMEKNKGLEKQLNEMTHLMNELKAMVGAKGSTKEGFHEAINSMKRSYALCHKDNNTLIEASVLHGEETVHVIGDIPPDLEMGLLQGDQTSELEQIVSLIHDVFQYEKDHSCRFNYRLKYATDADYKKAREVYEKYFYPEKILKIG